MEINKLIALHISFPNHQVEIKSIFSDGHEHIVKINNLSKCHRLFDFEEKVLGIKVTENNNSINVFPISEISINPLFYAHIESAVYIFNDIHSIRKHLDFKFTYNHHFTEIAVCGAYCMTTITPYEEINKFLMGHGIGITNYGKHINSIATKRKKNKPKNNQDIIESIATELNEYDENSVLSFSGGMDSTLLALIAQETKLKKIPLVHYCSDSPLENELYEAKRVAKYLGKELIIATRKTSIINEDKFMHTSNQYPQLDKSLTYGKIITECGINESTLFINGIGGDSLFKDNLPNPINYFQNIDKFMAECVSIDENLVKFFRQNITGGLAGSFFEHVMDAKKKCYLFNSNKHSINLINNINMLEKYTKRYSKPTSYWLPLLSEMGNAFSIKVNE